MSLKRSSQIHTFIYLDVQVKDINDMPPSFTKDEWVTEVDETDGNLLPDAPILTVTVHDEDESNKFLYKVSSCGKYNQLSYQAKIVLDLES